MRCSGVRTMATMTTVQREEEGACKLTESEFGEERVTLLSSDVRVVAETARLTAS